MGYNEIFNATDKMMNTILNAVEQNDFGNLNSMLKDQVQDFSDQLKQEKLQQEQRRREQEEQAARARQQANQQNQQWFDQQASQRPKWEGANPYSSHNTYSANTQSRPADIKVGTRPTGSARTQNVMTPFLQQRPKQTGAYGKIGGGVAGAFVFGSSLLWTGLAGAIMGTIALPSLILFGGGLAASIWLILNGNKQKNLIKKYYQYGKALGTAEYIKLDELAGLVGVSPTEVRKSLSEMMKAGLLPQARFDEKKTTLILTQQAYNQYQQAEDSRRQREQKEAKEAAQTAGMSAETRQILQDGEAYIKTLRRANDMIPDEAMSKKLDRQEQIVNRIFARVKEHPENASDLRKFMNYYLPTTEKLLKAYIDLDKQPQVGDNIVKTKRDINEAMDTINDAFENLLDSLFEDVAWDISSDISVMKTMMEQDGLTERKMKAGRN